MQVLSIVVSLMAPFILENGLKSDGYKLYMYISDLLLLWMILSIFDWHNQPELKQTVFLLVLSL